MDEDTTDAQWAQAEMEEREHREWLARAQASHDELTELLRESDEAARHFERIFYPRHAPLNERK